MSVVLLLCCSENEHHIPSDAEVRLIFGIVGVIRLLAGNNCFVLFGVWTIAFEWNELWHRHLAWCSFDPI